MEYHLFIHRYKRGTDIKFLLELGSNEEIVKLDKEIRVNSTKNLRNY